jgi:8-oxo-dGTP diphosphatase
VIKKLEDERQNMIKIGIDVHGVADLNPHLFSELSRILVDNGHEVHILTGAERTDELEHEIRCVLGLSFTHFFSTTSYHKNAGTEITYIDGNPYMDNKIWNRAKAEYCRKHDIQLHIDDSDVYGKYFKTPYAKFEFKRSHDDELSWPPFKEKAGTNEMPLENDGGLKEEHYRNPSVTVDIVICTLINGCLNVLLVKRKNTPFNGHWALPGGFIHVEDNEGLDAVAARKIKEKTGLPQLYIEQLKTYGDVDRDPRTRVITTAYYSLLNRSQIDLENMKSTENSEETRWFPLQHVEKDSAFRNEKLAFDHGQIVSDLKKRLQGKISHVPIAFEFLDKSFTWSDLRTVYEAVLGKKLDPANFKKKIKSQYKIKELKTRKYNPSAGRPPVYICFEGVKDQYI